jgi:2-oxo-4-hydroxy-4-carboxy--5-ureidoimidazoline (OHCU) decarboxylase
MSSPPILPSVTEIYSSTDTSRDGPLAQAFATLFEPSPALFEFLVPSVITIVADPKSHIPRRTFNALIDMGIRELDDWSHSQQASFIGGHPRIGEVKGLSALSASEQAAHATPPEILARLLELNEEYERRYPGLRYITFVNGRSRKAVMEEMEEKLRVGDGWEKGDSKEVHPLGSEEWVSEVRRALEDIGEIAKSRLVALKVDGDEDAAN